MTHASQTPEPLTKQMPSSRQRAPSERWKLNHGERRKEKGEIVQSTYARSVKNWEKRQLHQPRFQVLAIYHQKEKKAPLHLIKWTDQSRS